MEEYFHIVNASFLHFIDILTFLCFVLDSEETYT